MTVVFGTAGHIDHGKTALLRALTGIDADRLPEERARGLTIDVGYAHLALQDGTELDFVDVPGHDRLVGNMLVGAGEIDAALLVVAADDGPRAQTIEHLDLLDALGIGDGVVAITKIDAVPPDRVEAVAEAIRGLLTGTVLDGAPLCRVSSTTGAGVPELTAALVAVRDRVADVMADDGRPRLAVDRVFSIRGRGTVVTGTLRGGPIARGAVMDVVPDRDGRTVRVREVQVHGRAVEAGAIGRVALNVAGEGVAAIERGTVLADASAGEAGVTATDRLLVAVRPARGTALPADRIRVALHLGTARAAGMVARSGHEAHDLGDGSASVIVRLDRPIAAAAGDRFVLRRPSPAATLAGGVVVDPRPPRGIARRRVTAARVRALAAASPGGADWAAARVDLHGVVDGPPAIAADVADALEEALIAAVDARPGGIPIAELATIGAAALGRLVGHAAGDAIGRLVGQRIAGLAGSGRIARDGDRVLAAGAAPAAPSDEVVAAMARLEQALSTVTPPPLAIAARAAGCPDHAVRELERAGRIVRLDDDLAWAASTHADLARRALELARVTPLTPAAYRDATGTSRKYVMALLEDLDRRAVLRRTPAGHVPGPRAATVERLGAAPPEPVVSR